MNKIRTKNIICIFLLVVTFSVYSQVQHHDFINYDDNQYVTESSLIKTGLTKENIIRVFTNTHFGLWQPITSLSYMLDYQLYGLNPKGFHLTNLFFHMANSLLLFLVFFRMTGAIWQSAFVASMFAFHPLNVESVAWVSERKNVLSTLFWLLTIWAYLNYVEKPNFKTYSLVFLSFTFGLMSKPMVVTLPFVLLLLDYWPLRRLKFGYETGNNKTMAKKNAKRSEVFLLILEKFPLFLLAISFSLLTFYHVKTNFGFHLQLKARLINATVSYLAYLKKMIWPNELSLFYAHPSNTLPAWQGILCGMALVGITIISIKLIKKKPYFAVGWFWYLGTLLMVIGIFQAGAHGMADRYTYITLIGIFVVIAWGAPELISKWRYKEKLLSISAGMIIMALLFTTWNQVSYWKNSITVFKHAIKVTDKKLPNFSLAYNNLGMALYAEHKFKEAVNNFTIAIKLNPKHAYAHYNLGIALYNDGKNKEAISHYKTAIKLNPNFANAHYNLGIVLDQNGKLKEAIHHFRETVRIRPNLVAARDYLKLAKFKLKELQ